MQGFSGGTSGQEPACQCRRQRYRFYPWVGKTLGGRNGNPLQYSCLENPMDRGVWETTVHRVAKSQIWLKWLSMQAFWMRDILVDTWQYSRKGCVHVTLCIIQATSFKCQKQCDLISELESWCLPKCLFPMPWNQNSWGELLSSAYLTSFLGNSLI